MAIRLNSLSLINFRNYSSCTISDLEKVNLITGSNGSGKTNLIDGVYYACFGRSYFSSNDRKVLKWNSDFFRIEGTIEKRSKDIDIIVKVIPSNLKEILINGKKLQKISELMGQFPIIAIAPKEIYTLLLTSESRRKLIDQVIAQFDRAYLNHLLRYSGLLNRRNALLKSAGFPPRVDPVLLDSINIGLSTEGQSIYEKRRAFIDLIRPTFLHIYGIISNKREICDLSYFSHLSESKMLELLNSSYDKDIQLQRTTKGIHKDDLKFYINEEGLSAYGSQGQLKSFIIALKLALFKALSNNDSLTQPILLLDDIFDKFDEERTRALMNYILSENVGQVFITDASNTRMKEILSVFDQKIKHIIVQDGIILNG